jgi:hypothetical protein
MYLTSIQLKLFTVFRIQIQIRVWSNLRNVKLLLLRLQMLLLVGLARIFRVSFNYLFITTSFADLETNIIFCFSTFFGDCYPSLKLFVESLTYQHIYEFCFPFHVGSVFPLKSQNLFQTYMYFADLEKESTYLQKYADLKVSVRSYEVKKIKRKRFNLSNDSDSKLLG